jgi:SAM-dependent methyltransferase
MSDQGYLLDNRRQEAKTRFEAIADLFDAWTFQHIQHLGIQPGWRCWEVGAGGTNVPAWLAKQVGPEGHVLATDIDLTWAEQAASPNLEVRRHDVAAEAPPAGPFDLIHARLVLVHVPERQKALQHMVSALRPGGWLLIEDADPALQPLASLDIQGPEQALANKVRAAIRTLLAQRGADLAFGRKLPRLLREVGLADVTGDAYFPVTHPAGAVLETATIQHVREELLASGLVTEVEIEQNLANIAAGKLDLVLAPLISVWGRKPR